MEYGSLLIIVFFLEFGNLSQKLKQKGFHFDILLEDYILPRVDCNLNSNCQSLWFLEYMIARGIIYKHLERGVTRVKLFSFCWFAFILNCVKMVLEFGLNNKAKLCITLKITKYQKNNLLI